MLACGRVSVREGVRAHPRSSPADMEQAAMAAIAESAAEATKPKRRRTKGGASVSDAQSTASGSAGSGGASVSDPPAGAHPLDVALGLYDVQPADPHFLPPAGPPAVVAEDRIVTTT